MKRESWIIPSLDVISSRFRSIFFHNFVCNRLFYADKKPQKHVTTNPSLLLNINDKTQAGGAELSTATMMKSSGSLSSSSMAAIILPFRNILFPIFQSANKSLVSLSKKSKLLDLLRWLLFSLFFLLVHLLRSLPFSPSSRKQKTMRNDVMAADNYHGGEDTEINRALRQLLSLVGEIPASSRKYDVVRSLAEKLIHENLKEGSPVLEEINRDVLSEAFSRTLAQLEAALFHGTSTNWFGLGRGSGLGLGLGFGRGSRDWGIVRAVRGWYEHVGPGSGPEEGGVSEEKVAAELLWLVEKMEESGGGKVAVEKWAMASNLGLLALAAEPRVQASLVRLTAFLIKQVMDGMASNQEAEQRGMEDEKETQVKMLMTWLPMLCRASNGRDAPTLSSNEREEIERALEVIIDELEGEESQEKVLSLWLHHFTQCPRSDWPNLYGSYVRWCTTSRQLLLTRSS